MERPLTQGSNERVLFLRAKPSQHAIPGTMSNKIWQQRVRHRGASSVIAKLRTGSEMRACNFLASRKGYFGDGKGQTVNLGPRPNKSRNAYKNKGEPNKTQLALSQSMGK